MHAQIKLKWAGTCISSDISLILKILPDADFGKRRSQWPGFMGGRMGSKMNSVLIFEG